jgi:hypothetical protein
MIARKIAPTTAGTYPPSTNLRRLAPKNARSTIRKAPTIAAARAGGQPKRTRATR